MLSGGEVKPDSVEEIDAALLVVAQTLVGPVTAIPPKLFVQLTVIHRALLIYRAIADGSRN